MTLASARKIIFAENHNWLNFAKPCLVHSRLPLTIIGFYSYDDTSELHAVYNSRDNSSTSPSSRGLDLMEDSDGPGVNVVRDPNFSESSRRFLSHGACLCLNMSTGVGKTVHPQYSPQNTRAISFFFKSPSYQIARVPVPWEM